TSPYPMWDERDREQDAINLGQGRRVLDEGHETPTSSVLDAEWDEILDMPASSPWPVVLAGATAAVFAMLLIGHWILALVLTGILVCTSGPLFLASRAARAGRVRATWLLLFGALAVQAAYLGVQIHLFGNDLDKFTPDHSAYASIYFTLLGTHHFHVVVGILLEAWLLARLLRGLT